MKALVSTARFLLYVDLVSGRVEPLEMNRPEYYGISWFSDGSLVLTHSGLDNSSLIDANSYLVSERGWISHANTDSPPFLSAPHQVLCASDDRVVCTNTGRNAVSVLSLASPNIVQELRISTQRWDRLSVDECVGDHLNSVFEKDARLFVLSHNFKKGSRVAEFTYPELTLTNVHRTGDRSGLHNVWVDDNQHIICCDSDAGTIVDVTSDRVVWSTGCPVYLRGLAITTTDVVVGESQKSGRDGRSHSYCGLWILDRRTWLAKDYVALGPYGAVNEVRILDEPDFAHHGKPLPGHELKFTYLRDTLRRDRLLASDGLVLMQEWLSNFRLAFGAPVTCADGWYEAMNNNLCLLVQHNSVRVRKFEFDYEFNKNKDASSHVSVVLGYSGHGKDTKMLALMIHRSVDCISFQKWINTGLNWERLPSETVFDLPNSTRLCAEFNDDQFTVHAGERLVFGEALELPTTPIGVRWINCRIRRLQLL